MSAFSSHQAAPNSQLGQWLESAKTPIEPVSVRAHKTSPAAMAM
jgi:hypothetical protein